MVDQNRNIVGLMDIATFCHCRPKIEKSPQSSGELNPHEIKFEETAKTFKVELNKKKKTYRVSIELDTNKDNYQLDLSISPSGYANLNVISTHKQGISFYGIIEPIED